MARLSSEKILATIKTKGFIPVNISEYRNKESKIIVKCKEGHKIETTLNDVRKDSFRCAICHGGSINVYKKTAPPRKKDAYRVVAFDNATEKTGVSVYDNGELVYYTLLKFTGLLEKRLEAIFDVINQVIMPQWEPDFVIYEDVQFQKNYDTYKKLSMLIGILILLSTKHKIDSKLIKVKTWRSHFNISESRKTAKLEAIKLVKKMFDIEVGDDVAEAILIGRYASDKLAHKFAKTAF